MILVIYFTMSDNDNYEIIQEIETENFIWVIYLFIIGISFLANYYEKKYYKDGSEIAKDRYRLLNIFVFGVVFIIYLYFFKGNYDNVKNLTCCDSKSKIKFNKLNYMASILIVIAGAILLYIAIFDKDLETEIAFN